MADISKITLPSNDEYNIKDTTARAGLATKQDTLVSGTNIKTINNESLLGSGNITIQGGGDSLPDQTGHSGDILTTNGTAASWMDVSEASSVSIDTSISSSSTDNTIPSSKAVWDALSNVDALPDQTGHSGEYLTTTGSTSYWANLPKEIFWCAYGSTSFLEIQEAFQSFNQLCTLDYLGKIYIYTYGDYGNYSYHYFINVTGNEINKITVSDENSWSGPVSTTIDSLPSQTGNSGKYLTTNGTAASWGAASATSTKSIDSSPTSASSNLVTSGGVYTAINNKVNRTTAVNVADTNYTTLMARGVKLMDATSYDAVSDWSSELVNGAIAWRYE